MRVVHISTHDLQGGAGRAAYRLHRALRDGRVDSEMLVRWKRSRDNHVHTVFERKWPGAAIVCSGISFVQRLPLKQYTIGRHCDLFSVNRGPCQNLPRLCHDADIVHLHWTSSMLDLPTFFSQLESNTRIVWTLHDLNPMTGGCHYPGPCLRFEEGCGACPELSSTHPLDLSRKNFMQKDDIFRDIDASRLTIVGPSKWICTAASRSALLGRFPTTHIANGVDTSLFSPGSRNTARKRFNLRHTDRVVLFIADSLNNHRKGFDLLLHAFKYLQDLEGLVLLAVGKENSSSCSTHSLPKLRTTGPLHTEAQMVNAYRAADVFVIPSRQDNLPNTVLESLACGTPVVGFDSGGVPEMLTGKLSELIAPAEQPRALADRIRLVLEHTDFRRQLSVEAVQLVRDRFCIQKQAACYARHYEAILSGASGRQTDGFAG